MNSDDKTSATAGRSRRVLIAQSDLAMGQLLVEELARRDGPQPVEAASAVDAVDHLRMAAFAALVVDADLPDLESSGLLQAWRDGARRCPILLLRSAESPAPLIEADAVMTKPIRLGALVSWVLAAFPAGHADEIRLGRFRLDRAVRALVDEQGGADIRLTEKEVAILSHLAQADDEIVSREALLAAVWRYAAGANTNTVATHVYRLRRKLGKGSELSAALVTEPGGYRWRSERR